MKIGHNLYFCPWCEIEIKHQRVSSPAANNPATNLSGRHTVTQPLICPKCKREISQKTSEGFK